MKFADPKNDVAFHKIFGNENKKVILISFLNSVLDLKHGYKIVDLTFKDSYQLPKISSLKSSIIDVKVKDQKKNSYIVEMQVSETDGFDKRVQYYVSKEYANQIEKGDDYPKLTPVVFVGILDFKYFKGKDYITQHIILNKKTMENDLKDINFNFVELPKFKKKLEECKSLVDKWIFFIKNAKNLKIVPEGIEDKGLKEAYKESDKHNWTKDELEMYDYFSMREQDERGKMTLAIRRAKEQGKIEIAKEMKQNNESMEKILKYTGLTVEEIEKL
ncbi:MAG: Rpn family recombination-promoting nuclease/putative transposase [Leptospiraceae bacterium]|nr:Rpn family recombination-promoting nuclease/putative transposase [Leptospiraceae bacterium]MCP5495108.1 Rpn family recombination-promoting nuclease/putative transposase [Leptospiraceae bacterium]